MRKYLLVIFVIIAIMGLFYILSLNKVVCPFKLAPATAKIERLIKVIQGKGITIEDAFVLLKNRKDNDALVIFDKVLMDDPDNLDAQWGKAEVLRRSRDYKQAEFILNEILKKNPKHPNALVSLAHLKYQSNRLDEAHGLIREVLSITSQDKDNRALAYIILGGINYKRITKANFLSKIRYAPRIKGCFLRARELSPVLPEVHLGLGTFYLLAPSIVGGNLNKAIYELELTVKIAPDFATANARLAQCYQKKGDLEKCNFYLKRAKELDPENEVLKEIEKR